jgi:hypothetical protein
MSRLVQESFTGFSQDAGKRPTGLSAMTCRECLIPHCVDPVHHSGALARSYFDPTARFQTLPANVFGLKVGAPQYEPHRSRRQKRTPNNHASRAERPNPNG